MANTIDQDKEANPIAEIFDEVFTLMQDLETRSVAVYEYLQEQGGATDEKLAPYLDRAAGAADVRWRAARARMEHLLAPKPKSSTDVGKDDKAKGAYQSQPKEKGKDADSAGTKSQGEKQQSAKPESKDLGKELASAPSGTDKPADQKDEKTRAANLKTETESKDSEKGSDKESKEASSKSSDAEPQAASLAGNEKSEPKKDENANASKSENGKSSNQQSAEDKQQSQKAAK